MSGLISSILSTTNALKANQLAIETAGKNMSNVNNVNYSRQRVEFGISGGVSASVVTQQRDAIIDAKIIREAAVTGSLEVQYRVGKQLQVVFGEQITGDVSSADTLAGATTHDSATSGLSNSLDRFFTSLHAFSANPTDLSLKAAVVAQAEEMTSRFNTLSLDLTSLDEDVVRSLDTDLGRANQLLDQIASINKEIAKIEVRSPGSAHEFRDSRQQKLEELAKYINFDTRPMENGMVMVYGRDKDGVSGNEVVLVDGNIVANQLRFSQSTNEIYFTNHSTLPLGNSPNASAFDIEGGSLHGYLHVRSTTDPYGAATSFAVGPLAKMQEDLDTLARELASSVSAIYDDHSNPAAPLQFFDDDANPDAIDLTNVTAANIRVYGGDPLGTYGPVIQPLNSQTLRATATANNGSNEIALQLAQLRDATSPNLRGNTFNGFVSEMAASLGFELANNGQLIESQKLLTAQLEDQRASVGGVSIDEELANMVRFQRSFEASARVLKVMDELLSLIVNNLVR
jgi:flagellar hook-associated protein 1 FlgK